MPVDNSLYDRVAAQWWDENNFLSMLQTGLNPARLNYFRTILTTRLAWDPATLTLLDVGCGGGLLAEEFARLGCAVIGIDPSEPTIATARSHAAQSGLTIDYRQGSGEGLGVPAASFDVVCCCDVLEHVDDVDQVIAKVAQALKPGGIFLYDTINRTFQSKLGIIKLFQEWRLTSFAPPHFHDWDMFIRPKELAAILARHGLVNHDVVGIAPAASPFSLLTALYLRKRDKISFGELGRRMQMQPSPDTSTSYMGYARKES